ncbi:alpha/beta fold hydrolase [Fibrella aquatica]|uniref:alpha/beta fold hydrolase n=1 Tax=Fibrella aquatica TaxID=3242487 RepID=UPI003522F805
MLYTLTRTPPEPTGPIIIFLHYYGGSVRSWDAVLDQLATEFHCLAIDLPGFGDSPALSAHQTVDDVAEAVANVLVAQVGDKPFLLVGHSMGGKIALAIAAGTLATPSFPGLQSLLLLAPSPPGPEPIADKDRQEMLDKPGLSPAKQRKAAEKTADNITNLPISADVRQTIIDDNLRSSPEGWVAWPAVGSRDDITDRMHRVNVPVTILAGDQDRALSPSVQPKQVQPYLSQAWLHIIRGAGHLLPQETPDQVVKAIRTLCYQQR